ncbi:hypothetical protein GCM10011445_07470 [Pseudocitrobacter faecalis]|nr:hypothetical protein GCM10011445_07470 [Pseudocitrobacter faecalis]
MVFIISIHLIIIYDILFNLPNSWGRKNLYLQSVYAIFYPYIIMAWIRIVYMENSCSWVHIANVFNVIRYLCVLLN